MQQSETAEEVDHVKMVEDALWKQLAALRQSQKFRGVSTLVLLIFVFEGPVMKRNVANSQSMLLKERKGFAISYYF